MPVWLVGIGNRLRLVLGRRSRGIIPHFVFLCKALDQSFDAVRSRESGSRYEHLLQELARVNREREFGVRPTTCTTHGEQFRTTPKANMRDRHSNDTLPT